MYTYIIWYKIDLENLLRKKEREHWEINTIYIVFVYSTNSLLDHIPQIVGYFNIDYPIKLYVKGWC